MPHGLFIARLSIARFTYLDFHDCISCIFGSFMRSDATAMCKITLLRMGHAGEKRNSAAAEIVRVVPINHAHIAENWAHWATFLSLREWVFSEFELCRSSL